MQDEIVTRFVNMLMDNKVLTICFIIGIIDLGIMLWKSKGPYRYSEYRISRIEDMKEWLDQYNHGIYPVIGDNDETWSYDDQDGGYFIDS